MNGEEKKFRRCRLKSDQLNLKEFELSYFTKLILKHIVNGP